MVRKSSLALFAQTTRRTVRLSWPAALRRQSGGLQSLRRRAGHPARMHIGEPLLDALDDLQFAVHVGFDSLNRGNELGRRALRAGRPSSFLEVTGVTRIVIVVLAFMVRAPALCVQCNTKQDSFNPDLRSPRNPSRREHCKRQNIRRDRGHRRDLDGLFHADQHRADHRVASRVLAATWPRCWPIAGRA